MPVAQSQLRAAVRHALPVVVQALGSALSLLTVVIVSHSFGVEALGQFSLLKTWSDAIGIAIMFGLPQALLHLSYRSDISLSHLRNYAQKYAFRVSTVLLPLSALLALSQWSWMVWILLPVPAMVVHGLLRSILLKATGPLSYAWVTVCPSAILLVAVLTLCLLQVAQFGGALLASWLGSALVAMVVAIKFGVTNERASERLELTTVSRHAFVQNLCIAAQAPLLLTIVALGAEKSTDVGETSAAMVVAQAFAMASSLIAPILYDAVARTGRFVVMPSSTRKVGVILGTLVVVSVFAVPAIAPVLFSGVEIPSILSFQAMAVAGALMLVTRLGSTLLQANGEFVELTYQAVWRLSVSILAAGTLLLLIRLHGSLAVALGLIVGETVIVLRLLLLVTQKNRASKVTHD